jgi:hypothetical protein
MADYASEQTLQELLAEAKAMNASLQKMASVLGRAPAGNGGASAGGSGAAAGVASAATGMAGLAKSISPASIALTALGGALSLVTKAFGVIGSIIGDLAGRLGNAVGAVVGFAKQMVDGTATLTSMVGMFGEMAKQIPLVGGALGGLISIVGMVVGRLEDSFKMYKDVAASGMTFGGSLIDMRLQIQNAGLTVDEFAGIARANGALFATMGGNVQKGGELFLKSQQAITSGLKAEFAGLGMNAAEASSFLATYMKAQGSMNKDSLRDHRANAQAALELAQQTQFLTETTGKRREQIQQELEEAAKEANFKAYLSGLSAEDAAKAMAKLNFALQKGGKDAGDMLKTGMMTGVYQPLTAAQARTDAILGGELTNMVKTVGTATGSAEEIASKMSGAGGKLANAVDVAYKDVGTVNALQIAQGKQAVLSQEMLTLRNNQMENGKIKSVEKIAADEAAARAKITEDLKKGDAAGIGKAQMSLKEAGLKLNSAIDGVIGSFSGPLIGALSKAADFIGKNADLIKEYGDKFSAWLKPWVDKFTSVKSWDEFKVVMLDFWNEIKQKVGPILKDLWDSVKPVLASAVSGLFEMMWDSVKGALIPRMLRSDTEAEKEADRKKLLEQQIEAVKKQEQRVADAKAALAKDPSSVRAKNYLEKQENILSNAKSRQAELGGTAPAPQPDQAKVARDWAYSIMTGQSKESDVPANIKDSVAAAKQDPTLIKQAEDYKVRVAQEAAQEKARQEAAAQAAKNAPTPAPAATPAPAPSAAPKPAQDSSASAANVLNTQLATLVRASLETAEHTKKTASILASNGNALRR